ncbi:MAG: hypothetical protein K6G62_02640 [Eubacterium sp.]|nr:hypothetical protein [Eubacterium sp.]
MNETKSRLRKLVKHLKRLLETNNALSKAFLDGELPIFDELADDVIELILIELNLPEINKYMTEYCVDFYKEFDYGSAFLDWDEITCIEKILLFQDKEIKGEF